MKTLAPFLLMLALATTATAANEPSVQMRRTPYGILPYEQLFEENSRDGETMDQFIQRIAPRLRAWSDEHDFEACGMIATDGTRFGVVIGTNKAHIACANFASIVPQGMHSTDITVHSHGSDRSVAVNKADMALMGPRLGSQKWVNGQKQDDFSPADYQGGPGYLAGPDGLVLFQDGENTKRIVR